MNIVRLIDVDKLWERYDAHIRENYSMNTKSGTFVPEVLLDAVKLIWDTPLVDAVPVVHGHWKWISGCIDNWCSICGFHTDDYESQKYHYCPNCGAKMDETD